MLPIKIELPGHFLEEEERCGYTVSSEMKKVWAVELDLLNEFIRVCRENNIEFYGAGGTILGAERHGGFIPWDDDIDLMMTRENYNKLCACAQKAFTYPYFFQTEYTDPGSARGHAQLRNSETTGILKNELGAKMRFNQGIFIDIFPLDHVPDNENELAGFVKKLYHRRLISTKLNNWIMCDAVTGSTKVNKTLKKIMIPCIRMIDRWFNINDWLYAKVEKEMNKFNNRQTKRLALMPIALVQPHRWIWDESYFKGEVRMLDYEFLKIPVPSGYVSLLDGTYGNWREYVIAESMHGNVVFAPEVPYKAYFELKK